MGCLALTLLSFGQNFRWASPSAGQQDASQQAPGSISGTVVDQSGALVSGAQVRLAEGQMRNQVVLSDDHGQFSFAGVAPGHFQLVISSAGFATQTFSGTLNSAATLQLPPIVLSIASAHTTVQVGLPQVEVAEQQVKAEEKQRVLGIIPDFYVSYVPNAAPLDFRQKLDLAWKTTTDPFTFALTGIIAGVQQSQNYFSGYGQGAQGYAKRYGARYADTVAANFIGDALLPSLLKQDPRYFQKGTGSKRSRFLYALANAVICKGDNGHWQPNYSRTLGHLAAAGISNLYYPASDRHGAALTFENGAIGIGGTAAANLFQEFVVRRFTPKVHQQDSGSH
jgi:hypothetical protein